MDWNESNVLLRTDFHKIINDLGLKTGIEIGVAFGKNARYLLEESSIVKLYGVDNFSLRLGDLHKGSCQALQDEFPARFELLEMTSHKAETFFANNSVDYIYIDGDHSYTQVCFDLQFWYPKVKEGGFFGGHDYVQTRRCNVIRAVDEFFEYIGRDFFVTTETNRPRKSWWFIK